MTRSLYTLTATAIAALWLNAAPLAAQDMPDPATMDPAKMAEMIEKLSKMLTEADANKDGKTTKEELATHRAEVFSKLDRNNDGVVNNEDRPRGPVLKKKFGEKLDEIVPQFDTDMDGTMTRAEWNTQKRDPFEMLDANGDGAIETSEIPTPEMLAGAAG